MEKSQYTNSNKDTTNESAGVALATYGCESWTLRKNEETHLDAFEMKGLRKILRVSWTAKKTNEWVLTKAGVKRKLLNTVKTRKLAYYGHTMRKQGSCLEKEIMQGTMPGARRRERPCTDNIKTWTGLSVEESIRVTRGQGQMEQVRPWCGQPSDQGLLRTVQNIFSITSLLHIKHSIQLHKLSK